MTLLAAILAASFYWTAVVGADRALNARGSKASSLLMLGIGSFGFILSFIWWACLVD